MLWMSTRKCDFIKNFVRAMAVLSKVSLRFHISEPKIYHSHNVLERLRIAPDCIFETLRECSYNYMYYLKYAEYGHSMDTICISLHPYNYKSYMHILHC